MKSTFITFSILTSAFLLTGCDNSSDNQAFLSDSGTCLLATLEAMDTQDIQATRDWLERLRAIDPSSQFAQLALAHEIERDSIAKLNQALQQGDVETMAKILALPENTDNINLKKYTTLPQALQIIYKANQEVPWEHSLPIHDCLRQLEQNDEALMQFEHYKNWKKACEAHAKELTEIDRAEETLKRIIQIDNAYFYAQSPDSIFWEQLNNEQLVGKAISELARAVLINEPSNVILQRLKKVPISFQQAFKELLIFNGLLPIHMIDLKQAPILNSGKVNMIQYALSTQDYGLLNSINFNDTIWQDLSYEKKKKLLERFGISLQVLNTPNWKKPAPGVSDMLTRLLLWAQDNN